MMMSDDNDNAAANTSQQLTQLTTGVGAPTVSVNDKNQMWMKMMMIPKMACLDYCHAMMTAATMTVAMMIVIPMRTAPP
jgi:hypothetical protein